MRTILAASVLAGGLLLLDVSSATAQAGRAELNGTVFDQNKAIVPGATVTVVNEDTGLERVVTTGSLGRYVIPTLTPGTYRIRIELEGFQPQTRERVALNVGQELTLDFTLSVAALAETLTVTSQAPVVEVTTARIGTNITANDIDNLPTQGRNQLALMQLVPGVTPVFESGSFDGAQFNAGGRESGSNLFMIDGVYNNDDRLGGGWGYQARVALDSVSEFQVLTHQYAAEYGGSAGVVVNAVSRSGANQFSGRGFYYLQDDDLNATKYFLRQQGEETPESGTKIYGFNAGGPIVRNKAFWFFNLERTAIDQAVSLLFPPEAAPLATNFSDVSTIRVLNTFLRGDYQLSPAHGLSFRWLREAAPTIGEDWEDLLNIHSGMQIERDMDDQVFSANWTTIIGGRATNELKASHVRETLINGGLSYFDQDYNYIGLGDRDQFDLGSDNRHPDYAAGPRNTHDVSSIRTYVLEDVFTQIVSGWGGDHTFKVGGSYSRNMSLPQLQAASANGLFNFRQNRPFDTANPFTYPSRFQMRLGQMEFDLRDWRVNGFAQDKWQLNKNVTLNLGVRYDVQDITPQSKAAFAPRLGLAYDPTGSGKTVVRGGVGKFYENQYISVQDTLLRQAVIGPSYLFDTGEDRSADRGVTPAHVCLQPSGNNGLAVISPACRVFLTNLRNQVLSGSFVNTEPTVDGDRRLGYLWSFSGGVKHELVPNLAVGLDYVGARGRDQTGLIDINEGPPGPTGRATRLGVAVFDPTGELIPPQARSTNFLRVLQFQTRDDLNTDFNSLEASLERRYSNRWSGRFAYTLSRSRDVGAGGGRTALVSQRYSNDLNPRDDYGRSRTDNRHAVSLSFNASPWRGLGVGAMFRHYTGIPINETVGSDLNGDRDNFERPLAGRDDLTRPIVSELNANGLAVRNGINGEPTTLLDLRLQYIFNLARRQSLGLFWEIYNATDRVNFANPTGSRLSSNFLVPVVAGDPRTMQIGVRYTF